MLTYIVFFYSTFSSTVVLKYNSTVCSESILKSPQLSWHHHSTLITPASQPCPSLKVIAKTRKHEIVCKSQNYPKPIKFPPKIRFRPDHHEGSPGGPVCLYRREANLLRHRSKPSSCGDQGKAEGDRTGRGGTQALLSSPSSIQLWSLSSTISWQGKDYIGW